MSAPISSTSALDIALPAPVSVDKLDEVVLTPIAPDSNMNASVGTLEAFEDDKYIADGTTSPPETEMTGVEALLAAELQSGEASVRNSQQDIPIVFSQEQEPIFEDNTPPSSAISSHNQSQTLSQPLQAPTSEPQTSQPHPRGGQLQLGLKIPTTDKSSLYPGTTAGQKRSADGYIRRSSSSSSSRSSTPQNGTSTPQKLDGPDPKRHHKHGGHTRNVSGISTASSAMSPRELTNELKTRLSYAMVKVQKGWESLPIYDLESLASQSGSPSSSSGLTLNGRRTSAFGSAFTSPRVALARDQSSLSDKDTTMRDPIVVPNSANGAGSQNGHSRTYESFWRSQAQRTITSPSNAQHASLAPPTDVGSTQRPNGYLRRSHSKTSQPQRSGLSQPTSDLSTSRRFSSASMPVQPHTPKEDMATRITTALINDPQASISRTPLQTNTSTPRDPPSQAQNKKTQAMQEQDAIQTLLFMSSPGANFPPPSATSSQTRQGSPLKSSFSDSPGQNGMDSYGPVPPLQTIRLAPGQSSFYGADGNFYSNLPHDRLYGTSAQRAARRKLMEEERRRSGGVGRMTGEEVERLIDSYKGESSDEEVEIVISKRAERREVARTQEGLLRNESAGEQREQRRVALPTRAGSG